LQYGIQTTFWVFLLLYLFNCTVLYLLASKHHNISYFLNVLHFFQSFMICRQRLGSQLRLLSQNSIYLFLQRFQLVLKRKVLLFGVRYNWTVRRRTFRCSVSSLRNSGCCNILIISNNGMESFCRYCGVI